MPVRTSFLNNVLDALARGPDHVWVENQFALLGWGTERRFDVGIGPDRYERAMEAVREASPTPAFVSLTFDVDEEGSMVLIPETVARVDGTGVTVIKGNLPPTKTSHSQMPRLVNWRDGPWNQPFDGALEALSRDEVEKVVLSRTVNLEFDHAIPTSLVVENLVLTQPDAYVFGVEGLFGSSPELLSELKGRALRSTSLAGSAANGGSAESALSSSKIIREHDFAADSVAEALASHCVDLTRGPRQQARFADVVHLATYFEGTVRDGTSILDVIRDLHPTAAVAGTPTKAAVELIREIEVHDRHRYAGPVGWLDDSGSGTFAIAIRCGLIDGSSATLYTGAGLVTGSDSGEEYEETEIKLRPMLRALQIS